MVNSEWWYQRNRAMIYQFVIARESGQSTNHCPFK